MLSHYERNKHFIDLAITQYPNIEKSLSSLSHFDINKLSAKEKLYLGGCYLRLNILKKGFKLFTNRIHCIPDYKSTNKIFDPEKVLYKHFNTQNIHELENATLYIVLEQGFGDCFLWIRYILNFSNCHVYIYCPSGFHKKIIPICDYTLRLCSSDFTYQNKKFNKNQVHVVDSVCGDYDYWIYMCDLSILFNSSPFPYIQPYQSYVHKWKQILSQHDEHIIAINLDAMDCEADYRRVKIETILPILNIPGYKFININIDNPLKHPNILTINPLDTDFAFCDTAAIMSLCYAVLSVDTSIIHLAGAMNVKSVLMLAEQSEWRWFLKTSYSKWYPSIRIVRHSTSGIDLQNICQFLGIPPIAHTPSISVSRTKNRIAMLTLVIGNDYRDAIQSGIRTKARYCKANGYDFIIAGIDVYDPSRPIAWSKINMIKKYLPHYEYIFCSDADVVIMNQSITLESFLHNYMDEETNIVLTRDWQNLNTGNVFYRNCDEVLSLMNKIYEQTDYLNHGWWEQAAFIFLYENCQYIRNYTKVIEKSREFNAYIQLDSLSESPIPSNNLYVDGDFLIHFAGIDNLVTLKELMDKKYTQSN